MMYTVTAREDGKSVLQVLRTGMKLSSSAVQGAKWRGQILINGRLTHTRTIVHEGDVLEVDPGQRDPVYTPEAYALPLDIRYEDEDLMILSKQPGLASSSGSKHESLSLENAVYAHLGCPDKFIYRPVNRLDRGTGGLMAIAKNAHMQDLLQRQLHSKSFVRRYLAWTEGAPPQEEGVIDLPIGKAEGATVQRKITPDGKPCVTRYRVLSKADGRALVQLELETGRTHQIRVHLSAIGCPVVGDFLYGREDPAHFYRCFALHSFYLRLMHPLKLETLEFRSMPEWLMEIPLGPA